MFLASGPELVIAACAAGIVGSFPTANCRTEEDLRAWMEAIVGGLEAASRNSDVVVAPWAANLVTHSTNLRLAGHLDLVAQYKPPIVVTALGSPRPVVDTVHRYGGQVIADVPNIELARKAVEAGADGLACIASGAGGHTGHLSPFAFISGVRAFFDGLLVVGGSIADGAGVAGAIAAGADLVYIGTRFLASNESRASTGHKQMIVDCSQSDLIVTSSVTGAPATWLRPSLTASGAEIEAATKPDFSGRSRWRDIWSAGQGLQLIHSIEPVSKIVDDLAIGYLAAASRFGRLNSHVRG